METHIVKTDPNKCDIDGSPMLYFEYSKMELANGTILTRRIKMDYTKEYVTIKGYNSYEKWRAAIERAKKQFSEFNNC
jgi:hypothetical protein